MKPFSPHENQRFGLLFDRYRTLKKLLPNKNKTIDIIDVGANDGQTIKEIKSHYKKVVMHCFEPNSLCREKLLNLKKKIYKSNKKFEIILNFHGVSYKEGTKNFYQNTKRTEISSLYKINEKSKQYLVVKKKKYHNDQKKKLIKIVTLDKYIKEKKIKKIDLVKIDTQGHEIEILRGCSKNLDKINVLIFSVLFYDFYKKKRITFRDLEKVIGNKFIFWDICHVYKNPKYKNTDHVDVMYVNQKFVKKKKLVL